MRNSSLIVFYDVRAAKEMRDLPRVEDYSKALYTFDIGQNDLVAGFRKMSNEQFLAEIPDIINQLATAIRVCNRTHL